MPFTRGHTLSMGNKGGGRKGYKFEEEEMQRMRRLLDRYLTLMEKGVLTKKEQERVKIIERFTLKILDKMFPNKIAIKEEIEKPILIIDKSELDHNLDEAIKKAYGNKPEKV